MKTHNFKLLAVSALVLTLNSFILNPAISGQVGYSNDSFSSGDTLTADSLNSKFNELKADVNDNDSNVDVNKTSIDTNAQNINTNSNIIGNNSSDINSNSTAITTNSTSITNNSNAITTLQSKVTALETNTPNRFVDNGDGTISDNDTGLMWEKKNSADNVEDLSNPRDVDNRYSWSTDQSLYANGTITTDFLDRTNCLRNCNADTGEGLGGYSDWRLPTLAELRIITGGLCDVAPCVIDDLFLPVTANNSTFYWTSTRTGDLNFSMTVRFDNGGKPSLIKSSRQFVRAVRRFKN